MPTQRVLKFINLSIAGLLIAVLAAAFWYAWRPLPQTSGTIHAPVASTGTIARDALGVPHISAAGWEDAIVLQGFATAQDRMWQMDAIRRLAAGELSEVLGKQTLEVDREARRLRMRHIAEEHYRALSAGDRAVLSAYARGVNQYIESHRGRYGLEFALLRYDPKPWTVIDSILVGLQMFRNLTTSWKVDVQKQNLRESGDAAKVNFLYPVRSGLELTSRLERMGHVRRTHRQRQGHSG